MGIYVVTKTRETPGLWDKRDTTNNVKTENF